MVRRWCADGAPTALLHLLVATPPPGYLNELNVALVDILLAVASSALRGPFQTCYTELDRHLQMDLGL